MCGICGVISADPRPVEPAVRAMMSAMVHRGPDDEGFELLPMGHGDAPSPVVGLGFRRLSILDLSSAGHQPMFNERTGDCLVFNGEIYNFRQLRAELQCDGVVFRSTSDTEVLLQALCTWGESAVERLQGMFAFAFYHAESRRILLARDPLGIKPLYVAALPDRLLFASEIRPLLASGEVPADLDLAGIAGMLAYGAVQSPRTVFKAVRSFPAGHVQWIDGRVITGVIPESPRRYWDFPRRTILDDQRTAARTVSDILHKAVHQHLMADVPVGVFLSAGIDSTFIASLARDHAPNVTAFTVGLGSVHDEDEVTLASVTAKALGIRHVPIDVNSATLPNKWHDWLATMDSPSIDGFNTYVISRRLAAEGVKVGLSGLGADEFFGGYPTFDRGPRWSRILRAMRFFPRDFRRSLVVTLGASFFSADLVEKLADLTAGDSSVAGVTRALRRVLPDSQIEGLGLPANRVGLAQNFLEWQSNLTEPGSDGDLFNAVCRTEITHYMRDTLLRDTDANSMRHALEVRVPFLDLPMVNYVSALRGEVKRGRVRKILLHQAGAGLLPQRVLDRQKTGFTLPIRRWMLGGMRGTCEEAVQSLAEQSFISSSAVRRAWQSFQDNPQSTHWSRPLAFVVLGSYLASAGR